MTLITAKEHKTDILPVFITCDPARDSVEAVKGYVKGAFEAALRSCDVPSLTRFVSADFHPSLVGLTGTYEDIKKCCKA